MSVPDLAGEIVGPCRLLAALGSGGMGVAHVAEMAEDRPYAKAGERVAVKILHEESVVDAAAEERFRREARLGSTIRHRGVARTHEAGVATLRGATRHYLVMELLEGRTLRELLDASGTLPEPLLRDVGAQLADALAAIHAAGAVHGDIKPSNVFVTPDDRVVLVDLGVARLGRAPSQTSATVFLGSLAYASPEQLEGGVIGPGSDLYSLGVVLHEAAAGERPFAASDAGELVRLQLDRAAPRLGDILPNVTQFFEELVACLLEKEPARRFASAALLRVTLQAGEAAAWWAERLAALRAEPRRSALPRIPVRRDTSMVGRDTEMAQLAASHVDAIAGRGGVVVIEGEAGVGKSRLLADFVDTLSGADEPRVIHCSFAPGATERRGALAHAIVAHLGAADLADSVERLAGPSSRNEAFTAWLLGVSAPAGAEAITRSGIHAMLRGLARGLASDRPTIWIVEDLHFAGADDRALVAALAREAKDRRMLVIATRRPGAPAEDLAAIESLEHAGRIELARLDREGVRSLLSEAVASRSLAQELDQRLGARSGGNPFFVLEMVRDLEERRILRHGDDGRFELSGEVATAPAPSSIREVVLARMAALDLSERAVLDAGAVQGDVFDPDLVARVLGRERMDVLRSLADVERRTGIVRGAGAALRFDHHQIQEIAYEALDDTARRDLHARLASEYERREGLTGLAPDEIPAHAAVFLVRHFLKAGSVTGASRLVVRALIALDEEFQYHAMLELATFAERVIGDADTDVLVEILIKHDEGLYRLGRRDEERSVIERLMEVATASGDPVQRVRARTTKARLQLSTGEYEEAITTYRLAIAGAHETGRVRSEALARQGLGTAYREMLLRDLALEEHRKSLALWRSLGDRRSVGSELMNIAAACAELGRYEEVLEPVMEAVQIFEDLQAPSHLATVRTNLGWVRFCLGQWTLARQCWDEALAVGVERGEGALVAFVECNLGELDGAEGRLDSAQSRMEEALAVSRRVGDLRTEAFLVHRLGGVAHARGQLAVAEAYFEQALDMRRRSIPEGIPDSALALGRLLIDAGTPAAAKPLLAEASELARAHAIADMGSLPDAYLALLGERDVASVEVDDRCPVLVRAETRVVLHRAGAPRTLLDEAREILVRVSAHLAGEDLDAFWRWSLVARQVGRGA